MAMPWLRILLMAFRTHTSAAPLKHEKGKSKKLELTVIPHSHECGPVEAGDMGQA